MKVVQPLEINSARLGSSSIAEPDAGESVWNSGSTYADGAEVISTSAHRKYESLQAGNINHALPVLPETANDWWLDIGATNKYAMFDLFRNTRSTGASPIVVSIDPGERINSIGLLNLDASSITIRLEDLGSPAVVYYEHTESLIWRDVRDWYDYFYEVFGFKTEVARFDIPPHNPAVLKVTVEHTDGTAGVGGLVVGSFDYIGEAQRDAEFELVQFSQITRDTFGNATLVPRRSIPTTEQRILIHSGAVDGVVGVLNALDAVPALWSAIDDVEHVMFKPLLILGIYRNARFRLADPDCQLLLKLEEI